VNNDRGMCCQCQDLGQLIASPSVYTDKLINLHRLHQALLHLTDATVDLQLKKYLNSIGAWSRP
jgi:hypothetical protein